MRQAGATLCCSAWASHCSGFSCWGAPVLGHVDFTNCGSWSQYLEHTGLVAPWHVGSSWTSDQTYITCIGRQIDIQCTKQGGPRSSFLGTFNLYLTGSYLITHFLYTFILTIRSASLIDFLWFQPGFWRGSNVSNTPLLYVHVCV